MKTFLLAVLLSLSTLSLKAQTVPIIINCPPLVLTGDDGGGYLSVFSGVCTYFSNPTTSSTSFDSPTVTLTHATTFSLTTGVQASVPNLSFISSYLKIVTPDGRERIFKLYEDQGTTMGNTLIGKSWPLLLTLPAGTTFQYHVSIASANCSLGCFFNAEWDLFSSI